MSVRIFWRGSAPSKTKDDMAHRIGVINVGSLTNLGIFGCTSQRKMMIHLDQVVPYQEALKGAVGAVGE
jgi:hypothetical protein